MSYTNSTSHYGLPQYVATDKPKYLTDFNEAMATIDGQMYDNATAAATAESKADAAQDTADANTSSIGTLNTQLNGDPTDPGDSGLAGDVSSVQGQVDTINALIGNGTPTTTDKTIIGAINELAGDIADVSVRKFIFIGDSYNTDTYTPWGPLVAQYLGLSNDQYYNSGVSGSGFIGDGGADTFLEQLTTLGLSISDKSAITDIVVGGGVNDNAETDVAISTAVNTFLAYVHTNYPNAKVWLAPCNWGTSYAQKAAMRKMLLIYQQIGYNKKVVFPAFLYIHFAGVFLSDGGHLTEYGSQALARGMANVLLGGDGYYAFQSAIVCNNAAAGATSFTGFTVRYLQTDAGVEFQSEFEGDISTYVATKTIPMMSEFKVGTEQSLHLTGNKINSADAVTIASGRFYLTTDTEQIPGEYQVRLKGADFYLYFQPDDFSTGNKVITTLKIGPAAPKMLSLYET